MKLNGFRAIQDNFYRKILFLRMHKHCEKMPLCETMLDNCILFPSISGMWLATPTT